MQQGWRVGSSKISTNTRTPVNSVYHGKYFDSKYPCEVRGHSPVTGKARHTKGGVFVCFCRLFSSLLSSYKNTPQLNLGGVRHQTFLFANCPRCHTFHRSVSWYTTTRHFPHVGFVSSRKRVPDFNFYKRQETAQPCAYDLGCKPYGVD